MMINPALFQQLKAMPQSPQGTVMMAPQPGQAAGPQRTGGIYDWINRQRQQNKASNPELPYFEEDRGRLGGMLNGQSPFAGQEWGGLISTLQGRMNGTNSIADMAYRNAAQDNMSAMSSMARGSASPAAARTAMLQQGKIGQGMAAGVARARAEESLGASSALAGALGQRDQLNQNAYLDVLGKQLGLSTAQLEALLRNEDRKAQKDIAGKQASAAKWNAVAGGLGGLGSLI